MPATESATAAFPAIGPNSQVVVDWLLRPDSYPERPSQVELIETHISWVFLTNRYVYKLKKPVRFDFLDFSTHELRHEACRQELILNRRLAGSVYMDVIPITVDHRGHLKFHGSGAAVDWVVKMRRLPADRALHRLQARGALREEDVESLANCLAKFYQRLPPLSIGVDDYRRTLEFHLCGNWRALEACSEALPTALVDRVHERQFRWLRLVPEQFDHRVLDGRLVEGHGDLRPEHIYLDRHPVVIDCIEFNPEYRRLDVLDELGFLSMECDFLGAAWVGRRILAHYHQLSGDRPSAALLAFYKSYRACVRAKVLSLRADQLPEGGRGTLRDESAAYLRLADEYAVSLGPAAMMMVRGLPGTGKSTLARQLADALHVPLLQTDALRRERFGPAPSQLGYAQGQYQLDRRAAIYHQMLVHANAFLSAGRSVVLDGTFLASAWRIAAHGLARDRGSLFLDLRCACGDDLALRRIAGRAAAGEGLSETRTEFFAQQKAAEERATLDAGTIRVDTSASPPEALAATLAALRDQVLASAVVPGDEPAWGNLAGECRGPPFTRRDHD